MVSPVWQQVENQGDGALKALVIQREGVSLGLVEVEGQWEQQAL